MNIGENGRKLQFFFFFPAKKEVTWVHLPLLNNIYIHMYIYIYIYVCVYIYIYYINSYYVIFICSYLHMPCLSQDVLNWMSRISILNYLFQKYRLVYRRPNVRTSYKNVFKEIILPFTKSYHYYENEMFDILKIKILLWNDIWIRLE